MKKKELKLKTRHYCWYPPQDHQGLIEETVSLEFSKTAMLLVDVYMPDEFDPSKPIEDQNSTLSAQDYQLWRSKIIEGIIPALKAARKIGLPVIYVCNQNMGIAIQHSVYAKKLEQSLGFKPSESFKKITIESENQAQHNPSSLNFLDEVAPQEGDYFIGKTVYSGFFNTPLESLLRNLKIETLVCAGFRLDACLLGTVLDALYRNYQVILLRDAVLASELPEEIKDEQFTKRMLLHFEALIGTTCISKEFISACR